MVDVILYLIVILIPAVILHEIAHGLSAFLLGDPTARDRGRLTLNPIKHMDPVGSLIVPGALFLVSYFQPAIPLMIIGWAKPVPVNFRNLHPQRLGMALVAIAGPLTNIVLAFIFSRLYLWPALSNVSQICVWGVRLNLMLAVFNMTPIPPLDGSRVVTSLLPTKLAYYYSRLEPFGIIIVIVLLNFGMQGFLYPMIEQLGYWMGVPL